MICPRCGTADADRLGLCPACLLSGAGDPVVLGGALELGEEIGRGGMGAVYRARHLRLDRTVAVKLLPPSLTANPEAEARFEREARALALLSHPHIVAVHDFGREDGQSWLVMEFVDGPSFAGALPLPSARALELGLQICDAVAYAHQRGVVHRDLKPENVLLDAAGRAKVGDFGIARILRAEAPRVTSTNVALGTPRYMAPEALGGAPPDPRMDVYALGVLLYKMVMGTEPSGVFPPAPAPFDAVIRRALSSDPALRYKDAGEMRDALGRVSEMTASVDEQLPAEEINFVRGVAILQSISTAVALWAFLVCVTPKTLAPGELLPLISLGSRTLSDGRILSPARFETGWILSALATFAVAIVAYGFLRRHWRMSGLEEKTPDRPVRAATRVFWAGAVAMGVYGIRRALEAGGAVWAPRYVPVAGGLILVAALYLFWCAVLEAWRTSRPLRREPLLWLGAGLAVFAPVVELFRALR